MAASKPKLYTQGWKLDDIHWSAFDGLKVEPWMLAAVKAAALVEYNAREYVTYLKRVFAGTNDVLDATLERWGEEEVQHGQALGRWAEMADPKFDFESAVARFRAGFRPAHFSGDGGSIRGSRRAEMISRCVVESGTSSYYSAMKDQCQEPVLKEIAGRIAADEYRHYKIFYETLNILREPDPSVLRKLYVALARINESGDDELSYAYYCANVDAEDIPLKPYRRRTYAALYNAGALQLYQPQHVRKLVQMVLKSTGIKPQGIVVEVANFLLWRMFKMRARLAGFSGIRAA